MLPNMKVPSFENISLKKMREIEKFMLTFILAVFGKIYFFFSLLVWQAEDFISFRADSSCRR